jgi:glycosyltransferase involved in cell wall biosynthesis
MIVKNEHKHIRNCLTALQPLMQAVKSELIIADTGSTDDTLEICKEFTDKAFTFKWIDDFAAARQSTLEKAVGEWFMFIDADEYLDSNITELADFLNDPFNKNAAATFVVRNYDATGKIWSDFSASRIARNLPSLKFQGRIHEGFVTEAEFVYLPTIVHHYGYAYETNEQINAKNKRNMNLMLKEYEKRPNDVRLMAHMSDSCPVKEREKYLEKAFNLIQHIEDLEDLQNKIHAELYTTKICYNLAVSYLEQSKFKEAANVCEKYFELTDGDKLSGSVDMYHSWANAETGLANYEKAYELYSKFFVQYVKYHSGEIASQDAATRSMMHISPDNFACNRYRAAVCLANLDKFDDAFAEMDKINIPDIILAHFADFLIAFRILINKSKRYGKYIDLYGKIDDDFLLDRLIGEMENFYFSHQGEQAKFRSALIETGADIPFVRLMKLIENESPDEIADYFNSLKNFESGHSEAVYLAIKNKVYIDGKIIGLSTHENIHRVFNLLIDRHKDYIMVVTEYFDIEKFTDNIATLFFGMTMLEKAVYEAQYIAPMVKEKLYDAFVRIIADYVVNVYNPELLNEKDIVVLPSMHRFGYYMSLAADALAVDNKVEYVKSLRNALAADNEMRDIVAVLTEKFKLSVH